MKIPYLPYEERQPDTQYQDLLRLICEEGELTQNPHQTVGTYTCLTAPPLVYKIKNGFPIGTERKIGFWQKPIAELLAFMNGVRTVEELEKWGVTWWKQWAAKGDQFGLPDGDLGPGSYGAALHDFPIPEGGNFDQFDAVIRQMQDFPGMRSHVITTWNPVFCLGDKARIRKVVVAPCHGNFLKFTIIGNRLTLTHVQRSADVPIGLPSNIIQYAALLLLVAQVLDLEPYQYIHWCPDAQIYTNQVEAVKEIMEREPRPFPTMRIINHEIKDLLKFRPEHFELTDYNPHPPIKGIPVTE